MSSITERLTESEIENVASRDPLGCDYLYIEGKLAEMNSQQDLCSLVSEAKLLVERYLDRYSGFDQSDHFASVRDLSMLIGSLLRWNQDPLKLILDLKTALTMASEGSSSTPYHNVYHYGSYNPTGIRERSFTGTLQERKFIEQVRFGTDGFIGAIEALLPIFTNDIPLYESEAVLSRLDKAMDGLEVAVNAIPVVMKEVGPEFFANNLRPYFNPLSIEGYVYDAPGGSQMPLLLVDHILWASNNEDPLYIDFRNKNLVYLPLEVRDFINNTISFSPLVQRVDSDGGIPSDVSKAFHILLKRVYSFRKAHEKLAVDSFKYRNYGDVGSGGGTPTILNDLAVITRSQIKG